MATCTDSSDVPHGRLLQVSSSPLGEDDISADIIAIHSLGTTSPKTWEARGDQACGTQRPLVNWLSDDDMLPHVVPSAKIFTFTWNSNYYKDAPVVRIQDVAGTLLSQLQSQRDKENTHSRPLVFIASCFGGLIVTKALEIANIKGSEYQKLVVATSGVIFLGSPLQGTRAGTAAQWIAILAGVLNESPSPTLLQDLDGSTKVLRETSERFVKMIAAPPMQTMTKCFWESKTTQLGNGILSARMTRFLPKTKMILVEKDSACFLNLPNQQLDAPHVMMNKFRGPDDANFELVSSTIKQMVGEAKRITLAQREGVNMHNEHFMVSRRVNTVFTGREKEIKDLHHSLCPSQSTSSQATGSKIYVIYGLGGAGKSEVALKFAYENRAVFWGVFWLDASSENSLDRGFVDIAEKCDLQDKSFKGARSWLQETSHSWLLILDNADDPTLDYSLYLPSASKGHVLITSRVPKSANLQTAGKDCYETLNEETAVELLFKASRIDPSLYSTHDSDAQNIVNLLGCHALAIVLAGASISQGICDLGEYAKVFKKQRSRVLEIPPALERSRCGDVYATFEVSATYLSDRRDQTATDALELLNCYAFMSFTNFPETAFVDAWQNSRSISRDVQPDTEERIFDLSPWHRSHLPGFMRQDSSEELDMISIREAQSLLASLSIVVLDLPAHTTRMHPVTHMWARDRLEKQKKRTNTWLGALAVLCCSIEDPSEQKALWVQLQPHIELIKKPSPGDYLYSNEFHLHQSFYRLSWVLHKLRADKAVIDMLQTCFIEAAQSWTQFAYGADIEYLYGRCLKNGGYVKEAIKTLEHNVKVQQRLTEDHPIRLASQHELAVAYSANGQIDKAMKLLEHIVMIRENLVEDHPNRLASQHALAAAYSANKQIDKAIELLEHIVDIKEKLVEDHPDRLASQHELATAYLGDGQINQAIKLLEHIVKIQEKLVKDHPDRLASQHELARAYRKNGEVNKAFKLLESIVKIQEKLVEDHPSRLASQHELARTYLEDKQVDKAIKLLEHVVRINIETLVEGHPKRLTSQHSLAISYKENGQVDEAIKLLEHVVKIEKEKLAEDDPSRLVSQHNLAVSYKEHRQVDEAIKLLEHVVKIQKEKLAEDDPSRLLSQRALARAYRANGQLDKAVEIESGSIPEMNCERSTTGLLKAFFLWSKGQQFVKTE